MQMDGKQSATMIDMLKGAAIGAFFLAVAGQFWPGYMLDSSAKAESELARQTANDASAGLMCAEIYKAAPDALAKLAALRKTESYLSSQDADVEAASKQAIKVFADAKIMPAPTSYRVKSDCADQLKNSKVTAAQIK